MLCCCCQAPETLDQLNQFHTLQFLADITAATLPQKKRHLSDELNFLRSRPIVCY